MNHYRKYLVYVAALYLGGCADQESDLQVHAQGSIGSAGEKSRPVQNNSTKNAKPKVVREKDVIWDPLEPWNRAVFTFNQGVEHVFWDPILTVYRYLVPPLVQNGVHNVLEHVKEPLSIVSSVFQGDGDKIMTHFARFMCNTLFGLGGLIDIASDVNIVADQEDLGKAMKAYNIPPGCFVIIPFLGPTVSRDAVGKLFGFGLYGWLSPGAMASAGAFGAENLNQRLIFKDSIDHVLEYSPDPYEMIRRAYYESRGELPDRSYEDDIDDEDQDD